MAEQGSHGGKITDQRERSFKGFLSSSLPFRQGLNCSEIIAVMSKGNLPQTEAGSSVAVAPGKAELLSFLKCQPGTGTGNCAVIFPLHADRLLSETATTGCFIQKAVCHLLHRRTWVFRFRQTNKKLPPSPPQTLSPSPPFHNRTEYLKISLNGTSPTTKRWKSSPLPLSILPGAKEKRQMSVFISAKRSQRGCKPLLIRR